jgi:uncharacterized membrane protein
MDPNPNAVPGPPGNPDPRAESVPAVLRWAWQSLRGRILGGLFLVLPILITVWAIQWLYSGLEKYVIDPLALLVLWQVRRGQPDTELPHWFETYAAPLIAILIALVLLYALGFLVHSRLRQVIDWLPLRLPLISVVYNGVRTVLQTLDKQRGQQRPQRVVLVAFPHPGMKVPAFVTATCRDLETGKVLLCVYVPTCPVPTSGYFLLVPEEEVTELNWSPEQTLQAIISGGLTALPEVSYFKTGPAAATQPAAAALPGERPPNRHDDGRSPWPDSEKR